jgi:hypothetical protein
MIAIHLKEISGGLPSGSTTPGDAHPAGAGKNFPPDLKWLF